MDSQLKEIDESDRLIAFISGVMLRGTPVDEQIAFYSKNGKKDFEVWKRLQLLQATYVAKQVGADKVTPFKKGVIVGKPNQGSPSSGNQASARVSPEKKKSSEKGDK